MNMDFEKKLAIPMEVKESLPLGDLADAVERRRNELCAILRGESDKFLVVVGPCSADHETSVLDYVTRLAALQEKVSDKLFLVPRVYTSKPRTTSDGYKGMLHRPDPTDKPDLYHGILASRRLHLRVIAETGFVPADEMLYPENAKYFDDLLGYVTVGARSVEDQQHRLTASGLEMPVGMKNPTGGNLSSMLNAVAAAQHRHTFLYRGWQAHSQGNPYAHAILRGYTDLEDSTHPNYDYDTLCALCESYESRALSFPAVLIDASHDNSGRDPFRQPGIVKDVLQSRQKNTAIGKLVKGVMIESYLEDGAQAPGGTTYGQSITDPCLGWEKTERLLREIADL